MKKTLALILALALCLSLAACSGLTNEPASDPTEAPAGSDAPEVEGSEAPEGGDTSDDGYAPFVDVQGVDDTTIYVGNTAATTGSYATVGVPFNAGMEAAFKAYNDAGGFQGKKIELIHYDDGFDAAQGLTYTKTLAETDKVFAIVGHFGTNTVAATLDYLKEKGIPMVYAATDYSAAVNVLKNNGCDVVIACMNQAPLATLMASMRDADYNVDVITSYVSASAVTLGAFVENGSVTADRRVYSTAWLDTSTEEGMADYMTFYGAMSAWELENGGTGNDYALNSYAMAGYIAGDIFIQALKALDESGLELNWANFNDIMEATEFKLPMGGTISFANGDRLAVTSLALNTISLEYGESGYYELELVSPIMSLEDVLATIK